LSQKQQLIDHLYTHVEEKRQAAETAVNSAIESRDHDTKSSAGDKHETSRAMMQIELDKAQQQLAKAVRLKADLDAIDASLSHEACELGSLLSTNNGRMFMSIGFGKINFAGDDVFIVSMASPIAQALKGLKSGDTTQFQGKNWEILGIE
jgi:hypothetical protein